MGGYADYCMNRSGDGQTVAGICHARGSNAQLPAQWLIYINVLDLNLSIEQCQRCGGVLIDGPRGGPRDVCRDSRPGRCRGRFVSA